MAKSNIYRLISIITELADKIDENPDFWNFTVDPTLGIGLGCRALSGYLRDGAKEIITLQGDYQHAKEMADYNKADAEGCHQLLKDIFGDTEADEIIIDEWKSRFRELYKQLYAEEFGKEYTE